MVAGNPVIYQISGRNIMIQQPDHGCSGRDTLLGIVGVQFIISRKHLIQRRLDKSHICLTGAFLRPVGGNVVLERPETPGTHQSSTDLRCRRTGRC